MAPLNRTRFVLVAEFGRMIARSLGSKCWLEVHCQDKHSSIGSGMLHEPADGVGQDLADHERVTVVVEHSKLDG